MTAIAADRGGRTKIHTVRGGGGLRLHVREWGDRTGRRSCSSTAGRRTTCAGPSSTRATLADEFRLVACDLRGHGMSEAPLEPEHYTDGELWADDVAAIIDELRLDRPVLVGWSYGAFVICDYVRAYGQERIARDRLRRGRRQARRGGVRHPDRPRLPRPLRGRHGRRPADQHPRRCAPSSGRCVAKPLPADDLETALCWNIVVPAPIRAHLAAREIDYDDVLARPRACRCSSRTAGRTRSCCRRWPSTSSPPARPPRPPGTTASATPRPGGAGALQPRAPALTAGVRT